MWRALAIGAVATVLLSGGCSCTPQTGGLPPAPNAAGAPTWAGSGNQPAATGPAAPEAKPQPAKNEKVNFLGISDPHFPITKDAKPACGLPLVYDIQSPPVPERIEGPSPPIPSKEKAAAKSPAPDPAGKK